jgi:hypothetical protein
MREPGSWTVGPGQLQVQVAGQAIRGAAAVALAAVMIPLPGKLLKISCSSFLMPRLSSAVHLFLFVIDSLAKQDND